VLLIFNLFLKKKSREEFLHLERRKETKQTNKQTNKKLSKKIE
jgi:hypothetical protein